jgi:hypothetical protein
MRNSSVQRKEIADIKELLFTFQRYFDASGARKFSSIVQSTKLSPDTELAVLAGSDTEEVFPLCEDGEDKPQQDLVQSSDCFRDISSQEEAQFQTISTMRARRPKAGSSIVVQVPIWLLSRRFELRFRRAYGGWDHSLRTYRILPYEAAIFEYCINDDLEKIQVLFESGRASPFESDLKRNSLLHVSTPTTVYL